MSILFLIFLGIVGLLFIALLSIHIIGEHVFEEPLLYGTVVTITEGPYRGMRATTENKSGTKYLVTIETPVGPNEVHWMNRSSFTVRD